MAYPANLAVTNWGSLQSGNTADLDTNFRNVVTALNGIGNGTSVLQTVSISTAGINQTNIGSALIGQANITTISGGNASFFAASLTTPLGIGSGGTNAATFSNNSVVVITAGSMTGVLPIANGTVLMSNGTAWGPSTVPGSINPSPVTNSLIADVNLANTSIFYDGPSVNVGGVGTWFVSGTITLQDSTTNNIVILLWDGTNKISSGWAQSTGIPITASLSGVITNPAGNLKFSVNPQNTITGKIKFNGSGQSKDSTITAYRIF